MYNISEAAYQLNLKPHTLRYYEREGLIESSRNERGARYYTDPQMNWLQFVIKLRETQMPIRQIKEYAQLYIEGDHTSHQRLRLLEDHQETIQTQINTLKLTEEMLADKISLYKSYLKN